MNWRLCNSLWGNPSLEEANKKSNAAGRLEIMETKQKQMHSELMRRNGGRGCKSAEVGAKTADAGILGSGKPEKNPLPALEWSEGARDLLKVRCGGCGWIVAGRAAIFLKVRRGGCAKALFVGYFF